MTRIPRFLALVVFMGIWNGHSIESMTTTTETATNTSDVPQLNFLGKHNCWAGNPCHRCQGDCNRDEDCYGELVCYQRGGLEPVPGCAIADGEQDVERGQDFCTEGGTLVNRGIRCSVSNPCSLCEGDCDSNDECVGDLVCQDRNTGFSPIVGCPSGGGGDVSGTDYCVNATGPTLRMWSTDRCSQINTCVACHGDCDSDDGCAAGHICFERIGNEFVPGCAEGGAGDIPGYDYCILATAMAVMSSTTETTMMKATPELVTVMRGSLTLHVSNPRQFVQEQDLTHLLALAIADILEIDVTWVQNVAISLLAGAGRRSPVLNVRVEFEIALPIDGSDTDVLISVLSERFERATTTEVSNAIANVLNSRALGDDYTVTVVYKDLHTIDSLQEASSEQDSPKQSSDDELVTIIIVLCSISMVAAIVILLLLRRDGYHEGRDGYLMGQTSSLRSDSSSMEAAIASPTALELMFPPKTISEKQQHELCRLISDIACDKTSTPPDDEVELFMSYALAHRDDDTDGSGPGLYYAAALLKALHEQGIKCKASLPMSSERSQYLGMIRKRTGQSKVMLVVETPEVFNCMLCLQEVLAAQSNAFSIMRVRYDSIDFHRICEKDATVYDIEQGYTKEQLLTEISKQGYFEAPAFPLSPATVLTDTDSLRVLAFKLKWKMDTHAEVDYKNTTLERAAVLGKEHSMYGIAEDAPCKDFHELNSSSTESGNFVAGDMLDYASFDSMPSVRSVEIIQSKSEQMKVHPRRRSSERGGLPAISVRAYRSLPAIPGQRSNQKTKQPHILTSKQDSVFTPAGSFEASGSTAERELSCASQVNQGASRKGTSTKSTHRKSRAFVKTRSGDGRKKSRQVEIQKQRSLAL